MPPDSAPALTFLPAAQRAALSDALGLELAAYRQEHVEERVRRALTRERVGDAAALARLLRGDAQARARFRHTIAVSVSGLFRDRDQFDLLERELLPELIASRGEGGLRAWSAGAADGSELRSLAHLLRRLGVLGSARLLGSDLLDENVNSARRAVRSDLELTPELRERVRFEQRDLLGAAAFAGAWDLIMCRNVAIYLTSAAKRRLHLRLAAALAPGGVLLLGRSERIADPALLGLSVATGQAYRGAS